MTVTTWRIVKAKRASTAFSGDGSAKFGGRWNSPGRPMVYTAAGVALAALELYVHLGEADALDAYVVIPVRFDDGLVERLTLELPAAWRDPEEVGPTRAYGDAWLGEGRSAVLQVPSAVVPQETNYLLNPCHRDFQSVEIGEPESFDFDPRLMTRMR